MGNVVMPGVVEDAGGHSGGHWRVLLGCFFKGSAEGKGRRFHTNEAWRGFFLVVEAGDR